MADIAKINGVAVANIAKVNGRTKLLVIIYLEYCFLVWEVQTT